MEVVVNRVCSTSYGDYTAIIMNKQETINGII